MSKRIWVTWETQRRSIELSARMRSKLFIFDFPGKARYLKSIISTIRIFLTENPRIIFVQNPSMILAAAACWYRVLSRTPVVVDRHTTFLLTRKYPKSIGIFIFKILNQFTLRTADLTIVTNEHLASLVRSYGGKPFVLPDPIPILKKVNSPKLAGDKNIVLISSFGLDEPIQEAIEAMRDIADNRVCLYITGNFKKCDENLFAKVPDNVVLTGFLSDQDFVDLLFASDAIMALTTADYCMLCGCYEAIAAKKPLITSDKRVLKDYFINAFFTANNRKDIRHAVLTVLDELGKRTIESEHLNTMLRIKWNIMFLDLIEKLDRIVMY